MEQIGALISRIREYTFEHDDLRKAHHFNFDIRTCPHNDVQFVVMGLNPADSEADNFEKSEPDYKCKETSSTFDFREEYIRTKYGSRENLLWNQKIKEILPEGAGFTQTERFFWSSHGGIKQFRKHFGTTLHRSKHLSFCRDINVELIDIYNPKAIICTGTSDFGLNVISKLYELTTTSIRDEMWRSNIPAHYHDKNGRDWIFVPHLTGARGFTTRDRESIKAYIRETSNEGSKLSHSLS
jgi:transposase-like protein